MFATTRSRELAQGTTRVVPYRELAPNIFTGAGNYECVSEVIFFSILLVNISSCYLLLK